MFSCAGPGTQCVTFKYRLDWSTYLSTSLNVIYMSVDSRGSSGRGARFMHAVHRRVGSTEVSDQLTAARSTTSFFRCFTLQMSGFAVSRITRLPWYLNFTDGRTDGRMTYDSIYRVHRAVIVQRINAVCWSRSADFMHLSFAKLLTHCVLWFFLCMLRF